jgi:hypothetical protein
MGLIDAFEDLFLAGADDIFVDHIVVALKELFVGCIHEEVSVRLGLMFEAGPSDDDQLHGSP